MRIQKLVEGSLWKEYKYGEEYRPPDDSRYKRLLKKPINTLSFEEVVYIYAIHWCIYMSQLAPSETSEEAVQKALDRHEEDLQDCYKYVSSLKFPLSVYRAIRVNEFSNTERTSGGDFVISGKNNSRSWSTNIDIYKNEKSKFRKSTDIVACEIEPSIIDNAQTISNYVSYTAKPDYSGFGEYEITLKKNFKQDDLHNLRVIDKNEITESLKRGNKMTVEEYKKNRKARLQRLGEALDNLPELTDGKAHIEVDAVTGGAKAEAEDRKKQVKDSFKDKNKETREFIKKQDKDREVDKEEKSENRLMLDESLFNEEVELTESRDFDWDQTLWAVVKEDGAFAGVPCVSWEEARELASQHKGSHIYKMTLDDGGKYFSGSHEWYKNESLNKKSGKKLNESLYSDAIDVIYDLVDRAKSWIDDGDDKDEAISHAIDDGLIYSDDIFALARYFGGIDDSTLIESFYESLYELMYEKLGDYGQEEEDEEEDEE